MRLLVALALVAGCHKGTGPENDALLRGLDAHGTGDGGVQDAPHDAGHDAGGDGGSDAGVPVDAMPDGPP